MKDILIHQSLHGYSEGHRLLESSLKLPDEIARLILRMSDLSGGSIFPGFEEYLTGYPVPSLNLYVFAKTWYAAEMPRPGCVWTHSLILQSSDMGAIPSLDQLIKFFVRPKAVKGAGKSAKPSGSHSNSLRFVPELSNDQFESSDSPQAEELTSLVTALYHFNRRNLLVPALSAISTENSIMKIWSQQWPALRSHFSFCTGALSSRGFAGKPFDIQCAPPQLIREIVTSALAKQSQEMSVLIREESAPEEPWINVVVSDASTANGGPFRKVLWSLADGSQISDFKNFAFLTMQLLSDKQFSLQELISLVARQFPECASGSVLKKNLFGERPSLFQKFNFSEWEILSELSVLEDCSAFDSISLNLRSRANQLCKDRPDDAKQLMAKLFSGPINSLGEDVLAGLLEAMNPEIAKRITEQQPHFLPTLFRAKPELGTSADLWRAAGDHVRELFESLSSTENLSEERITGISEAIMASGSESLVRRAMDKWGKPAVFGVLNHVAKSGNSLSERVMGALTFHDVSVMEWVTANADSPLFVRVVCAHVLAPYSYKIKGFGSEIWLRTYEELRNAGDYEEINYLAIFLLALAFQNASPEPTRVIALCFEYVHQLGWDDRLPDENWIVLDPLVPHLLWLHDWDKCERMRRGLIEAFVKFHWPAEELHGCIKSDSLLSRILKSAKSVDGGMALFSHFNRN